jgi:hypothetical protein
MIACSNCGTPVTQPGRFCTGCGARLDTVRFKPVQVQPSVQETRWVWPVAAVAILAVAVVVVGVLFALRDGSGQPADAAAASMPTVVTTPAPVPPTPSTRTVTKTAAPRHSSHVADRTRVRTKTVTAPAPAAPPPPVTAQQPLPLGTPFRIQGHLIATVLDFQSNVVGGGHEPDQRYADLNIRVCALAGSVVSSATWSLIGATDDNLGTVVTGGGLHEPQYPSVGHPLNAGECVQGWITFVVPGTLKIKAAKYSPSIVQGQPLPHATWDLSAA